MNDIQIRIAAALDKGDFTAAQQELEKLRVAVKEIDQGSGALTASQQDLTAALRGTNAGMSAAAAVMRGDMVGAMNAVLAGSRGLQASLPQLAVAAGIFAVAFKLGSMIDEALGLSDAISARLVPAIESLEGKFAKAREEAEGLVNLRFAGLRAELEQTLAALEKFEKDAGAEKRRSDALRRAEYERDVAEIEAGPGPDTDKARQKTARRATFEAEQQQADSALISAQREQQQAAKQKLEALEGSDPTAEQRQRTEAAKRRFEITPGEMLEGGRTEKYEALKEWGQQNRILKAAEATAEQEKAKLRTQIEGLESKLKDTETAAGVRAAKTGQEAAQQRSAIGGIDRTEASERARAERARARAEMEALKPEIKRAEEALGAPAGKGANRRALEQLEASGEVDGRRYSPQSRAYRDRMAELQEASAKEEQAMDSAATAILAAYTRMTARLTALEAQLKTDDS